MYEFFFNYVYLGFACLLVVYLGLNLLIFMLTSKIFPDMSDMIQTGVWAYKEFKKRNFSKAIFWLKSTIARFVMFTLVIIFLVLFPEFGRFCYKRTPSIDGLYAKIITVEEIKWDSQIYIAKIDIGYGIIREAILENQGSAPKNGEVIAVVLKDSYYRNYIGGYIIKPQPLAWL